MTRLATYSRRHKVLTGVFVLALIILIAFAIRTTVSAPPSTSVRVSECIKADGGACIRFPAVTGTNLLGTEFQLPQDFAGGYTLVIMPFDEDQTRRAESWLPLAQELAAAHPQFAYYDLPTLKSYPPLMRGIMTGGMSLIITDDHLRAVTIMLFLEEKELFLDALAIPDTGSAQIFLLNGSGEVLWRASGDYTESAGTSLRVALASALNS